MSEHDSYYNLSLEDWKKLRKHMRSGQTGDALFERIAGHVSKAHGLGVLSTNYGLRLREHHHAVLSGEVQLEAIGEEQPSS